MLSYKELVIWQRSTELVIEIYRLTKLYPREELYGVISQTRRAAVSIPSNIAEGYARRHRQEYTQFVRISFASGAELETLLLIAKKLKLEPEIEFKKSDGFLDEVMRMLNKMISSLVAKP